MSIKKKFKFNRSQIKEDGTIEVAVPSQYLANRGLKDTVADIRGKLVQHDYEVETDPTMAFKDDTSATFRARVREPEPIHVSVLVDREFLDTLSPMGVKDLCARMERTLYNEAAMQRRTVKPSSIKVEFTYDRAKAQYYIRARGVLR